MIKSVCPASLNLLNFTVVFANILLEWMIIPTIAKNVEFAGICLILYHSQTIDSIALLCYFFFRIHGDRSFHCDVCGVCLDVQLKGNHKCRPDSAHDNCGICFEVYKFCY